MPRRRDWAFADTAARVTITTVRFIDASLSLAIVTLVLQLKSTKRALGGSKAAIESSLCLNQGSIPAVAVGCSVRALPLDDP